MLGSLGFTTADIQKVRAEMKAAVKEEKKQKKNGLEHSREKKENKKNVQVRNTNTAMGQLLIKDLPFSSR